MSPSPPTFPTPSSSTFNHPYTPYAIQLSFMTTLYKALSTRSVAILESPTGTGKSLSLICGALTWLRDYERNTLEMELNTDEGGKDDDEPAWIREQAREEKRKRLLRVREEMEERLRKVREREEREKKREEARAMGGGAGGQAKRRRRVEVEVEGEGDEEWELKEWESEDEGEEWRGRGDVGGSGFSKEVRELMEKYVSPYHAVGWDRKSTDGVDRMGMSIPGEGMRKRDEDEEMPNSMKIYFCSRTHSQLSQFVSELRRVNFPSSVPISCCTSKPSTEAEIPPEPVKHLSLGSRRQLCINPKVNTPTASVPTINERCLDLQKTGASETKRCQFLPKSDEQSIIRDFRDRALATIRDIEDLAELGKEMGVCPYYAAREAVRPAEIITLPYQLLLQESAREALGIDLKDSIIIIDEAHNLMDTITSLNSVTVTLTQLHRCQAQLDFYLQKFRNRLKGGNKVYVMQIQRVLRSLVEFTESITKCGKSAEGEIKPGDVLATNGVDQIDFRKLQRYITESKLARKIEGYQKAAEEKAAQDLASKIGHPVTITPKKEGSIPLLMHIQAFLTALTNPSKEGKIFFTLDTEPESESASGVGKKEPTLEYKLLDPAPSFAPLIENARSIILAGGTMSPMSDYTTHLFPTLSPEKLLTLSCGHVIPRENILAYPLVRAPSGREFEFTFEKRNDAALLQELGIAIVNLCRFIPKGVVLFFPSYGYLAQVVEAWKKQPPGAAGGKSVWDRLADVKDVFLEERGKGVEQTLGGYRDAVDSGKKGGAVMLAVVGGKLSEGINFNDDLGRGVIMIGLPFPNSSTPEWQAKLNHIESLSYSTYPSILPASSPPPTEAGRKAYAKQQAKEFYENACMRAVNQSIGRAIRHRQDYAVIVLVDRRYASERIREKLPGWIGDALVKVEAGDRGQGRVVDVVKAVGGFFRGRK